MKTGALLRFACCAGPILGRADADKAAALDRYGVAIGQAFQIADDLLDVEGDQAVVGKATGKDAAAGKATMVQILGITGAKARLQALVTDAENVLAPFEGAGGHADCRRSLHRRSTQLIDPTVRYWPWAVRTRRQPLAETPAVGLRQARTRPVSGAALRQVVPHQTGRRRFPRGFRLEPMTGSQQNSPSRP